MRKILVVEDNQTSMEFFVAALEYAGHQVWQAEDAETGIAIARDTLPNIIFMDIQLPGMDGLEATRQLKADPVTRHIPIYAWTAFATKSDEERFRAAGCDGCLTKQAGFMHLLATVAGVKGE